MTTLNIDEKNPTPKTSLEIREEIFVKKLEGFREILNKQAQETFRAARKQFSSAGSNWINIASAEVVTSILREIDVLTMLNTEAKQLEHERAEVTYQDKKKK